jgi:hypothetical protein
MQPRIVTTLLFTGLWLPDLFFPDVVSKEVGEMFLKLSPGGNLAYSRHFTVELLQSTFDYRKFPMDEHTISLRWISYAYTESWLVQYLANPPVTFFPTSGDSPSFTTNPVWQYESSSGYINTLSYSASNIKSEAVVNIVIKRNPDGVVTRLAVPLFLLAVLGGIIFWAVQEDARFDSTVTLLLAISALYIVVFQNIPMVGYLTTLDEFSLMMFAALFVCCFIHQIINRILQKKDKWPTRYLMTRSIEGLARIIYMPVLIIIFFVFFGSDYGTQDLAVVYSLTGIFVFFIVPREYIAVKSKLLPTIEYISSKVDDLTDLTSSEILLFNLWVYRRFSFNMSRHRRELREKRLRETVNPIASVDHDKTIDASAHDRGETKLGGDGFREDSLPYVYDSKTSEYFDKDTVELSQLRKI